MVELSIENPFYVNVLTYAVAYSFDLYGFFIDFPCYPLTPIARVYEFQHCEFAFEFYPLGLMGFSA